MQMRKKVIASIIIRDNKVMIAQRAKKDSLFGLWEFPGGKLEENESEIECLQRELSEEFGIKAHIGTYLCSSYFTHKMQEYEMRMYHVPSYEGEIKLNEHSDLQWVSVHELDKYPMPDPDKPIVIFLKSWL